MIKRIIYFSVVVFILFVIGYFTNKYLLENQKIVLSFSLLSVYLYQAIATVIVYTAVEIIYQKYPVQSGYTYLVSVFLKIGLFILIFQSTIFAEERLTRIERLILIIPVFVFLITEAIAVSKLLTQTDYKSNDEQLNKTL